MVPKGEYLQYGGLAIIEGVMMRSPKYFSVACRAPNGQIVLQTEPVAKGWLGRQKWLRLPFLRGPFALIDSMALGNRALAFASNVQLDPKYAKEGQTAVPDSRSIEGSGVYEPTKHGGGMVAPPDTNIEGPKAIVGSTTFFGLLIGVLLSFVLRGELGRSMSLSAWLTQNWQADPIRNRILLFAGLGLVAGFLVGKAVDRVRGAKGTSEATIGIVGAVGIAAMVALFIFLPQVLGEQARSAGVTNERLLNLISGGFKLTLFIGYVSLIRRMKAIYRVFQFHGAEHKAINTMEAGQDLTMENCQNQTRLHPRCGTNFAVIVLLLDIAVMTFVMRYPLGYGNAHYLVNLALRALINIPILILVSGVAYEMIRLAGRFRHSWLVNCLFAPGLATQFITTAPPQDDQVEVALVALRAVMEAEEEKGPGTPEPAAEATATL